MLETRYRLRPIFSAAISSTLLNQNVGIEATLGGELASVPEGARARVVRGEGEEPLLRASIGSLA